MVCRSLQQLLSLPMNRTGKAAGRIIFLLIVLITLTILTRPSSLLASGNVGYVCPSPPQFKLNNQPIRGLILPHHEVAKMVWRPTFKHLSQQKIKRVILLSPNHFWLGKQSVTTASQPSVQEDLAISIDQNLVTLINQSRGVEDNPEIVWQDHGVINFIPIIKEQLPEAQILPILFKKNVSLKQIDGLVKELAPSLNDQTIVIASLDFAHEVLPLAATKNDKLTQSLIKKRDYYRLLKLSSAYIDSPIALVTFLKLMDAKEVSTNLIWQSHAGEFNQNCSEATTSYQVWMAND